MRDQGLRGGRLRLRFPARLALARQRRLERGDIVGQVVGGALHTLIKSEPPAFAMLYLHPAALGRQVWRGLRQSIPSSM